MAKKTILPWICTECNNVWVDHLFATWEECPECGGEAQHGRIRELTEVDEWYE